MSKTKLTNSLVQFSVLLPGALILDSWLRELVNTMTEKKATLKCKAGALLVGRQAAIC